ncbi:MAG: hypothetical protein IH969_10210 [Candidatus Krumholzibacteriota bacterium]|nr:hypothetical protein [Candidatus Krumholzibacteriota bacterium]
MAGIAIIVSFGALGVAAWQSVQNHRHHRVTTRPRLVFYLELAPARDFHGLRLTNEGHGSAIVTGYVFHSGRKRFDVFAGPIKAFADILSEAGIGQCDFGTLSAGTVLSAGRWFEAVSLREPPLLKEIGKWVEIMQRVQFEVQYESEYGERFVARSTQTIHPPTKSV